MNKPTKAQLIRIDEQEYTKLLLLDASILDVHGNVRYGSINALFNKLLVQHNEALARQAASHLAMSSTI